MVVNALSPVFQSFSFLTLCLLQRLTILSSKISYTLTKNCQWIKHLLTETVILATNYDFVSCNFHKVCILKAAVMLCNSHVTPSSRIIYHNGFGFMAPQCNIQFILANVTRWRINRHAMYSSIWSILLHSVHNNFKYARGNLCLIFHFLACNVRPLPSPTLSFLLVHYQLINS